jgi:hypothetical protein
MDLSSLVHSIPFGSSLATGTVEIGCEEANTDEDDSGVEEDGDKEDAAMPPPAGAALTYAAAASRTQDNALLK